MEHVIDKILSDFGVTALIAVILILTLLKYIPSFISNLFDEIKRMRDDDKDLQRQLIKEQKEYLDKIVARFEKVTDKIVESFEKQIQKSDDWHKQHQSKLEEVSTDVKDIKFFILKKGKDGK